MPLASSSTELFILCAPVSNQIVYIVSSTVTKRDSRCMGRLCFVDVMTVAHLDVQPQIEKFDEQRESGAFPASLEP